MRKSVERKNKPKGAAKLDQSSRTSKGCISVTLAGCHVSPSTGMEQRAILNSQLWIQSCLHQHPVLTDTSILDLQTSTDVEELQNFLDESVAAGTEGLIVKTMDSTYEPSRRSAHWLKLKKDYLKDCGDTFDVVPIGAWHGR